MVILKNTVRLLIKFFSKILYRTKIGDVFYDVLSDVYRDKTISVNHNSCSMMFFIGKPIPAWRARTFKTKEPETLEWIETFDEHSVFWDVGANVGIYSIYSAKLIKGLKVYCFEPSVFNLEYLATNININGLNDRVFIIANALSEKTEMGAMQMSNTKHGGALCSFGTLTGHDGNQINPVFSYQTLSFSIDDVVNMLHIPAPNYIKIDVDGIEYLILAGAKSTLLDSRVKSILVEVNDEFQLQARSVSKILKDSGFELSEKRQSEMIHSDENLRNTYNQIWTRP